MYKISIILPVFNEEDAIRHTLESLQGMRVAGHEIIIVDSGSTDKTIEITRPLCDMVITGPRGRAAQMNAGVMQATGDMLWFIHADTRISTEVEQEMLSIARQEKIVWGRFNVSLSGTARIFRVIESMMNLRSRISGIATGDQAIFMHRKLYEQVGGYPAIDIMEDIAICMRLKKITRPYCLLQRVVTDSRQWEKNGVVRTTLLMWKLRLAYALGCNPDSLARQYYGS